MVFTESLVSFFNSLRVSLFSNGFVSLAKVVDDREKAKINETKILFFFHDNKFLIANPIILLLCCQLYSGPAFAVSPVIHGLFLSFVNIHMQSYFLSNKNF